MKRLTMRGGCGWVGGAAGGDVVEVVAAPSSGMKVAGCAGAW